MFALPLSPKAAARLLLCLPALLLSLPAQARTWHVRVDGSGDAPTIQAAVDLADSGDVVLVGPGHYTWSNQGTGTTHGLIRFWKSEPDDVSLISEVGPEQTIIDAEFHGRVFFANGNNIASDPVEFLVEGFTFQNGIANIPPNYSDAEGGGMALHLTYATIRNCIFTNNRAEFGGGAWVGGVSGNRFEDCRFISNRTLTGSGPPDGVGGGLCVINSSQVNSFVDCLFEDNTASYRGGGVILVNARVEMVGCVFADNRTLDSELGIGSGVYCFITPLSDFQRCLWRSNDTSYGPALAVRGSTTLPQAAVVEVHDSIIADNWPGVAVRVSNNGQATFTCTNINGHPMGDWVGLEDQLGQNGNLSVDCRFCVEGRDWAHVHPDSPMLAPNNSCGVDLGNVVGSCAGVPVLVSSFTARWSGDTEDAALLRWELARAPSSAANFEVVALDAGAARRVEGFPECVDEAFELLDLHAPRSGARYRLLEVDAGGSRVGLASAELPSWTASFRIGRLWPALPNPFNPRTTIRFELLRRGHVTLSIHDGRGRRVRVLVDGMMEEGDHQIGWDATDGRGSSLASGVYFVSLVIGRQRSTQRLALVR